MDQPKLSDRSKRVVMMMVDAVVIPFALWAAVVLRYGDIYKDVQEFWWLFPVSAIACVPVFYKLGLYRAIVRYIGPSSMLEVIKGVTVAAVAVSLTAYLSGAITFPRTAPMIFWVIAVLLVGGGRLAVRAYFYGLFNSYLTREQVAIYGAGDSGTQLAFALLNGQEFVPVAFIDDDRSLRRNTIHGIRVHDAGNIPRIIEQYGIRQILLAVPSATHSQRKAILDRLADLPVRIRTVPDISDLVSGRARVSEIREVDIEDLLGRDTVPPDEELLAANTGGKNVMVTGAAGSIGSELSRQIARQRPKLLLLFDIFEYGLYELEKEFERLRDEQQIQCDVVVLLGSIQDKAFLRKICDEYRIETVYHAAAYKHVQMVEQNVIEGVRNNVFGTLTLMEVCIDAGVSSFVLISTDKAVRPTNVMGASKRVAELIVHAFAVNFAMERYCMVRFGNVLGSSGSVVPLFRDQIASGGPVTVTHPDATRFFMTIAEAAELVIQAGAMATGGDVFVLDMGEPVKIHELAANMIALSGHQVVEDGEGDVAIEFTGLRLGDKLHEELLIGKDVTGTSHSKILRAREEFVPLDDLKRSLAELQGYCQTFDEEGIYRIFSRLVSGLELSKRTPRQIGDSDQKAAKYPDNLRPFPNKPR